MAERQTFVLDKDSDPAPRTRFAVGLDPVIHGEIVGRNPAGKLEVEIVNSFEKTRRRVPLASRANPPLTLRLVKTG